MSEPAVVTGRVTNTSGSPEAAVLVRIEALNVQTTTVADGSYRLVIPASRVHDNQSVVISASRVGLSARSVRITLSPGSESTQNFQMNPDAISL